MNQIRLARIEGSAGARRHFRYFDYLMAAFVAILLLSNLIGAAKLATMWGYTFGAGILFFPVSYVLGDVLTEVYGYAHARRCVWVGFFALLFMAFMSFVVVAMPPAAGWGCASSGDPRLPRSWRRRRPPGLPNDLQFGVRQHLAHRAGLGRCVLGGRVRQFLCARADEGVDRGKYLFTRTWGSTIFGQAVDSALFYPIAFRHVGDGGRDLRDDHQSGAEGHLGNSPHARHVCRGGLPQAAGRRRCVRHGRRALSPFAVSEEN